ncbi:MAG: zinc ribbon domain-containing protein [Patescibacteria group bacterium]
MANSMCESCMMPFSKDPGVRENEKYCSYCFKDGKLVGGDDLKAFQKCTYDAMVAKGMNPLLAKFYAWMIRFAPRWKK